MVVRSNGTRECLGQELFEPLLPGEYKISIALARSDFYVSIDKVKLTDANYSNPVKLEIIGITQKGEEQVLYLTEKITSSHWTNKESKFLVKDTLTTIKISPQFVGDEYYNGNILIDNFIIYK